MDPLEHNTRADTRPNILILCMDQWDRHMKLPDEVRFPAMERLQAEGVTFDRHYCTVPICSPSRASMWTGVHAKKAGLWDNTNFAWIGELSSEIPTIGHMFREQGYYTAFKGKWHLSEMARSEDALERHGFADCQQWGEMYGKPLEGEMIDGAVAFHTVDWLESKGVRLEQPWLLVCSLINPHDIMYYQSDPIEQPDPAGAFADKKTPGQRMEWFEKQWNVSLPDNFADDLRCHPPGVRYYKAATDRNYGGLPDERTDLWLKRRNYLINAMRLVDAQFLKVLDALDRTKLWENTIVVFTSDHGEMNGAHRMTQKGAISFDEAAIANLTVCVPGGPKGQRTAAVGSHLDLAPTLLEFAGLGREEIATRFPQLKGRSLKEVILDPTKEGPRGSANAPGSGALLCWDGLHSLDYEWAVKGALRALTDLPAGADREAHLKAAGEQYGAPDFNLRTFFRIVVDGRYKLVRWFNPQEYGNPSTLEELHARSDLGLYDLVNDPGELENLAHPDHPAYDSALIGRMLGKLHALIQEEIGEDQAPFSLDLFGTRAVKHDKDGTGSQSSAPSEPSPLRDR